MKLIKPKDFVPHFERQLPSECVAGAITNLLWLQFKQVENPKELDNRLRKYLNKPELTGLNLQKVFEYFRKEKKMDFYRCDNIEQLKASIQHNPILISRKAYEYKKKFKTVHGRKVLRIF